ncbi:ubiquitin carboxyl-terminal hydrolase 31-like [Styela clava]
MPSKREKQRRKTSFKTFGAFLTSHMMRKFTRKKYKKSAVDNDALEAGFIDHNSHHRSDGNLPQNGNTNGQNNLKNNGIPSETVSLSGKGAYSTSLNGTFAPPGVCGLANHGSTCYINAIVQCLSNTDLIAEYFVMGQYRADLKNARKERSKKYGTNGELADQLALLIKSLWMNNYDVSMTKGLKDIMCKYASQYKGCYQHDSQEFLLWLFDKVHEDLNIQPVKKAFSLSRASFRRKKKVADPAKMSAEAKDIQAQLDIVPTSFVQKVFQAHFRSTLTCPNCKRQSHTNDPFLCVSLPITQRTTRAIYVNVAYLNRSKRKGEGRKKHHASPRIVQQIAVAVALDGKVLQLRQLVAAECGIHSRLLTFVEYGEDGFGQSYGDDMLVSKIPQVSHTVSKLYALEMPAPMKMTAGTLPRNFASRHKKRASFGDGVSITKDVLTSPDGATALPKNVVIVLVNKKIDGKNSKVFGRPLIFHVSKDVLNEDLRSLIITKLSEFTKKGVNTEKILSVMKLHVVDGLPNKSLISQKSQQPLLTPTAETALQNCPAGGPLHIKLIAEWEKDDYCTIFEDIAQDTIEEQESVRLQRLIHQQPVTCTLQECFDLLTKPEELGIEDSWDCPHCHKAKQGTVKKLSLYTLPDVLIVHLKRFQAVNDKRNKLNTRVDFPIMGLDMSPYLLESSRPKTHQNGGAGHRLNGLRNHHVKNEECLYDLYAVCNHFGNLNSGHYTASCLNPLDGQWYNFDDRKTEVVSEENLSQQSVYILFYQRRSINPSAPCAGGSVSSLATSDHWALSLQQPTRQKASSQSRLNEYAVNSPMKSQTVLPVSNGIKKHHSQKVIKEVQGSKMPNGHASSSVHKDKEGVEKTSYSPKSPSGENRMSPNLSNGAIHSSPKSPNGGLKISNENNNSNRRVEYSQQAPKSSYRDAPKLHPSGRRYSGGYDLYRKEKELLMGSRRNEKERNSIKNRQYFSPQLDQRHLDMNGYTNGDFSNPHLQYQERDMPVGYNRKQAYNGVPVWNYPQISPQVSSPSYEPVFDPYDPFVRGVPRQQSVPRSISKAERAPVNTRRLSERYHRTRPSSQYEPYTDTYKRTTYF